MAKATYVEEREGGFYLTGSRISLDSIVHAFRRGESPEGICQNFEVLDLEEVYGAIAYYLGHQDAIDDYLRHQESKWIEGKRDSEPLPGDLRERLLRARAGSHSTNPS